MGSLGSKRNTLILVVAIILALVMIYLNFTAPAVQRRDSKARELAAKKQEIGQIQQQIEKQGQVGPEISVKLSQVRKQVPESDRVEELLRELRMLEVVSQTKMSNYTFDLGKGIAASTAAPANAAPAAADKTAAAPADSAAAQIVPPTAGAYPIKFNPTVRGEYKQIVRLLNEIQSSERLFTVDKITFNVPPATPVRINAEKQIVTCTLNLSAYYAPALQKLVKTPPAIPYAPPGTRTQPIN